MHNFGNRSEWRIWIIIWKMFTHNAHSIAFRIGNSFNFKRPQLRSRWKQLCNKIDFWTNWEVARGGTKTALQSIDGRALVEHNEADKNQNKYSGLKHSKKRRTSNKIKQVVNKIAQRFGIAVNSKTCGMRRKQNHTSDYGNLPSLRVVRSGLAHFTPGRTSSIHPVSCKWAGWSALHSWECLGTVCHHCFRTPVIQGVSGGQRA